MVTVLSGADSRPFDRSAIRTFDSYGEFVRFGEQGPSKRNSGRQSARKDESDPSWDMGVGYDGAVKLAESGWREAADTIQSTADKVAEKVGVCLAEQFETEFGVTGVSVDVGRAMSGEPECMVQPVLVERPRAVPMVSVVIESGVAAGIDGDLYLQRGAAVLALLEVLRQLGIPAEVWLSTDNSENSIHLVPLVKSNQPIDVDELAFVLAHPAAHRRVVFAAREAEPLAKCPEGYGSPPNEINQYTKDTIDPTVYLKGLSYYGQRPEITNPVKWIIAQLQGAGLEINSK